MLDKLQYDLDSIRRAKDDSPAPEVQARFEVFSAEASHVLSMALAADSPLMTLFNKYRSLQFASPVQSQTAAEENAPQPQNAAAVDPFVVIRGILEAAMNLNKTRDNEESNPTLAEDIDRILSRKFIKHPVVYIPAAALSMAAIFAVYGDINFQNMRINVVEDINKKATEAKADILTSRNEGLQAVSSLQAKVAATSTEADKLKADIGNTRQAVSDLTASAVRDLSAQQTAIVNNATNAATKSIATAASQASEAIVQTRDAQKHTVENAGTDAKKLIDDSADQAVRDAKARVAPAFDKAIGKAASEVDGLQGKLSSMQNHTDALNAALRAMSVSPNTWSHRLAAYFDQAVTTVYAVLAGLAAITVINLAVLALAWRKK